jgi:hypothetical protein
MYEVKAGRGCVKREEVTLPNFLSIAWLEFKVGEKGW